MAAEDGLKAQKLLAQGVWMQNTLFFQGVLDVTYDPPLLLFFRFTYHISKTPIPLEKVGWGISCKLKTIA